MSYSSTDRPRFTLSGDDSTGTLSDWCAAWQTVESRPPLSPGLSVDPNSAILPESTPSHAERDEQYYLDFAEFSVEDSLFQTPRYHFDQQPSSFWESIEPVSYNRNAIKLGGIQKKDFVALLDFLYPDVVNNSPKSLDEWKSILKLTFKWGMHASFKIAAEALQEAPLHEQVLMARKYGVYDWLKSIYTTLANRKTFLSQAEATSLGLGAALDLIHIREHFYRSLLEKAIKTYDKMYSDPKKPTLPTLQDKSGDAISEELQKLQKLESPTATRVIDQIVVGRKHGFSYWVEHGYQSLLDRTTPISFDEGMALGLAITVSLCNRRESAMRNETQKREESVRYMQSSVRSGFRAAVPIVVDGDIAAEVANRFKGELDRLTEINSLYGTPFKLIPPPPPDPKPEPDTHQSAPPVAVATSPSSNRDRYGRHRFV